MHPSLLKINKIKINLNALCFAFQGTFMCFKVPSRLPCLREDEAPDHTESTTQAFFSGMLSGRETMGEV